VPAAAAGATAPPVGPPPQLHSAVDALAGGLLRQEDGRRLARALDTLPFYERTALVLLVQQGYSYQEIAAAMDTPISTIRTRLWRACRRLRAHVVTVDAAPPRPRPSCGAPEGARRCVPQQWPAVR